MKAIVQDSYCSANVLELREVDKPRIRDREILVRVSAAGVNPGDRAIMNGLPYVARPFPLYLLLKPRSAVRGTDVAGVVHPLSETTKPMNHVGRGRAQGGGHARGNIAGVASLNAVTAGGTI